MPRLDVSSQWDSLFFERSPIFNTLDGFKSWYRSFLSEWPVLDDYQQLLAQQDEPVMTRNGFPLCIVPQADKPGSFEQHYAPRIYISGEIQTRIENWHDFFQLLSWIMFPRTKAMINETHIPLAQARIESGADIGRRSPLENLLSLFDEGGAVVISSDESLLQMVRDFHWKSLFWQQREALQEKLTCIVFGHAMYEKGLEPYIGMTANAILLHCDETFFQLSNEQQLAWVDEALLVALADREQFSVPKDLSPFPILGMPGWDANNGDEAYYDNQRYFRPGRGGAKAVA
ncbi:MAG: DUF3025 domain-containing protein [Thiotrichaceae bacterium]|nr:DUF3025 domain-containing protein [Thiotrichaceae bacterium]